MDERGINIVLNDSMAGLMSDCDVERERKNLKTARMDDIYELVGGKNRILGMGENSVVWHGARRERVAGLRGRAPLAIKRASAGRVRENKDGDFLIPNEIKWGLVISSKFPDHRNLVGLCLYF